MGLALVTITVTSWTLVLAVSPSGASARATLLTCANARVAEPARYDLGCGSGTYVLANLRWTNWSGTTATASGTYVVDTCVPTCAGGRDARYRATITLGPVSATTRGPLFRRARIRYDVRGAPKTVSWALPPFS